MVLPFVLLGGRRLSATPDQAPAAGKPLAVGPRWVEIVTSSSAHPVSTDFHRNELDRAAAGEWI